MGTARAIWGAMGHLALRSTWAAWALAAPLACAAAAPAWVPGEVAHFAVELPDAMRQLAGPGDAARVERAVVDVALPARFDAARAWPVLLVNATSDPGHQSSRALAQAYRSAATAAGWIVIAADPEPAVSQEDDRLTLRFVLSSAALAALQLQWPRAGEAPLALAGFSGGAKYSGWLAAMLARQGRRVAGVYLAGINEEPLEAAARQFGVLDDRFRRVPVFLQGGLKDRVATPAQHRRLQAELLGAGFTQVRLEVTEGGHAVDAEPLSRALAWFAELASAGAVDSK